MSGILIVAPHADDETFGLGGWLIKHKLNSELHWVIGTYENKPTDTVSEFYSFDSWVNLNLLDGRVDEHEFHHLVELIAIQARAVKPSTVFMPYLYDAHSDHRVIAQAVLAACKPFRAPFVKNIYMYETISETNLSTIPFAPNCFCDITKQMEEKKKAILLYKSEIVPFARGVKEAEALAIYRGMSIGVRYAEAFQLVRGTM
jgi:LmbE family N-acetylglucosaminyl deacetylase